MKSVLTQVIVVIAVLFSATALHAQTAARPVETKPEPAAAKAAPEPAAQPFNIKIEVLITDQVGPGEAAKKTVSMLVGDRQNNSIRTTAQIRNPAGGSRSVGINVDARPVISVKEPNKLQLSFGLEYSPKTGGESSEPNSSSLTQRLSLNLESGKPVVVSQAADPTSDRKITVEVTATILK